MQCGREGKTPLDNLPESADVEERAIVMLCDCNLRQSTGNVGPWREMRGSRDQGVTLSDQSPGDKRTQTWKLDRLVRGVVRPEYLIKGGRRAEEVGGIGMEARGVVELIEARGGKGLRATSRDGGTTVLIGAKPSPCVEIQSKG